MAFPFQTFGSQRRPGPSRTSTSSRTNTRRPRHVEHAQHHGPQDTAPQPFAAGPAAPGSTIVPPHGSTPPYDAAKHNKTHLNLPPPPATTETPSRRRSHNHTPRTLTQQHPTPPRTRKETIHPPPPSPPPNLHNPRHRSRHLPARPPRPARPARPGHRGRRHRHPADPRPRRETPCRAEAGRRGRRSTGGLGVLGRVRLAVGGAPRAAYHCRCVGGV